MEYEPEIFPGMVYRRPDLGVVLLLFNSGRVVCVGAKKNQSKLLMHSARLEKKWWKKACCINLPDRTTHLQSRTTSIIINNATENNFISAGVMSDVTKDESDHYLVYAVFNPNVP